MRTVNDLLASPPASPAFQAWWDRLKELHDLGSPIAAHCAARASDLRRMIAKIDRGGPEGEQAVAQLHEAGITVFAIQGVVMALEDIAAADIAHDISQLGTERACENH